MNEPALFSSFEIKSKILRNRVVLSPMCQYKAENGMVSDWHSQHYSRFAFSGLGAAFIEATGVSSQGRITHGCTGIWSDDHIQGLSRIVNIFKEYNCISGIQLAHAGRKASFLRPWDGASPITSDAVKETNLKVPLVVRLAGTNFKEGKKILEQSDLKILSALDLNDAAKKIVKAIE